MSLTSFLTQSPAVNQQQTGQISQALPQWYADYTAGILSNAAQFANQGYNPYPGPQVAGPSADQQSSYGTVNQATGLGQGIAQQGVGMLNNSMAGPNPLQTANPYLQSANQGIQGALGQPNAAQAGNPYLQSASSPVSGQIGQFMNPYMNDVVNTGNFLTSRNFNENVLPGLQDQFTQAGQVGGGTRQGLMAERMGRDLNLNQQMASGNLLAGGFNTALGGAQGQQQLLAGIGNTAGNLANAAQGTGLYGAGLQAGLGSTAGGLAGSGEALGISGANTLGGLGTTAQGNALQQAMVQNQMGQQQQQNTQANYNVGLQNFLQQQQYPLMASQAMGSALQGIQVPSATTSYGYQTPQAGYGNSPLTNMLGTYAGVSGLGNALGYGARGGYVRMAKGGRVRKTLTLKSPLQVAVS